MSDKITCDNCGSVFALVYDEDEVSYSPSHCPFCGDYYDTVSEELNFSDDKEDFATFKDDDDDLMFGDD
jgi:hypothetical protein